MASKQVLFESEARERLLRGVTASSDAVRVTLGPKSKSVLIEKKWGAPLVCDDADRSDAGRAVADKDETTIIGRKRDSAVATGVSSNCAVKSGRPRATTTAISSRMPARCC
jgi:chaperonin GroEL